MTVALAVIAVLVTVVVIAAMVRLVPRRTERVRRRHDAPAESQGSELTPTDRAS